MYIYLVSKSNFWSRHLFKKLGQHKDDYELLWFSSTGPSWEKNILETVSSCQPSYIFFFHWSEFIPKELHENYKCVSFHTSNLPDGRGGSPIQNQIIDGLTQTHVNAFKTSEIMDGGDLYLSEQISLQGNLGDIWMSIADVSYSMIQSIIKNDLEPIRRQDLTKISKVYKRLKDNSFSFEQKELTLNQLYDKIRMVDAEGYPNMYTTVGDFTLEFSRAKLEDGRIISDVTIYKRDA